MNIVVRINFSSKLKNPASEIGYYSYTNRCVQLNKRDYRMSKIECKCGKIIPDTTDFISYKGHLIADQDYFDFFDEIEKKEWNDSTSRASKYFNEVFQCTNCHNIIILRDNKRFDFKSIDTEGDSNILNSYLNEKWLGLISANFRNGQGEIYWHTNLESGFRQELSLVELKNIYYRKFEELMSLNILRHSFLKIDGKIEHDFDLKK